MKTLKNATSFYDPDTHKKVGIYSKEDLKKISRRCIKDWEQEIRETVDKCNNTKYEYKNMYELHEIMSMQETRRTFIERRIAWIDIFEVFYDLKE